MLGLAISIAAEKFKAINDKGDRPYILHCIRVMQAVQHLGEDAMCAAILHDVVEDIHDMTIDDLQQLGFNDTVCTVVDLLTKPKHMPYSEYICTRVCLHSLAIEIKKADLIDNLNVSRIKSADQSTLKRLQTYLTAYEHLTIVSNIYK